MSTPLGEGASGDGVRVWWTGLRADGGPEAAQDLLDRFLRHAAPVAAVIAPFDRALTTDLATPVADTLWGWVVSAEAECRWRVEGDRAAMAVVAESPLDGFLEAHADCAHVGIDALSLEQPVRELLGTRAVRRHRYAEADGLALSRVEVLR